MAKNAPERVRARDLRANIKELGFEKGVTVTLELLLEDFNSQRNTLNEAIAIISRLVDSFDEVMAVATHFKTQLEEARRVANGDAE